MPTLLPDLTYNQKIPTYAGGLASTVDALGQELEQKYYTNQEAADNLDIALNNMVVRNVNQPLIQDAKNSINQQLKSIKERGDWENARTQVRNAAIGLKKNPLITGALQDKAQYDVWRKDLDEQLEKGQINKNQYDYYLTSSLEANNKPIEYDQEKGTYSNVFAGSRPNKDMSKDISADVEKIANSWKSSTREKPVSFVDKNGKTRTLAYNTNLRGYYDLATEEYVDENEVKNSIAKSIKANPAYDSFLTEDAAIKTWQAKRRNGLGEITTEDFYDPKNPRSLLTADEFTQLGIELNKQGIDGVKALSDPQMREALYALVQKNKTIDGIISGPAEAASFSKIKHEYKENIDYREALKFGYDMKKLAQKHSYDLQLEAMKEANKKKEDEESKLIIKTPTGIVNNPKDLDAIRTQTARAKSELDAVNKEIEDNKKGNSSADISQLLQRQSELQTQLGVGKRTITNSWDVVSNIPEDNNYLQNQYKAYKDVYPNTTFDQFKKAVIEYNPKQTSFMERFRRRFLASPLEQIGRKVGVFDADSILNSTSNYIAKKAGKIVEANPNVDVTLSQGLTGNALTQPDDSKKSGIIQIASKTLTNAYKENKQGFYVTGGATAADWEQAMRKELGGKITSKDKDSETDKIEVKIVPTDADHSTDGRALFPHKITVTNKETGETRSQFIYEGDGGLDTRRQIAKQLLKSSDLGTAEYRDAEHMYAQSLFPELVVPDINSDANFVKSNSNTGTTKYEKTTKIGGVSIKLVKKPYTYDDGSRGVVWTAELPNGRMIPNFDMKDVQVGNQEEFNHFKSLDDLKVNYYRLITKK